MKKCTFSIFTIACIAALLLVAPGCKKDKDKNDQTIEIVGDYTGNYRESDGTFVIDLDNVGTEITKVSDSEINVRIKVVPGLASLSFSAEMNGTANFTVPTFTYDVDEFEGSGSLFGNTLSLHLDKVGEIGVFVSYEGVKQ